MANLRLDFFLVVQQHNHWAVPLQLLQQAGSAVVVVVVVVVCERHGMYTAAACMNGHPVVAGTVARLYSCAL
jgi:hypothetical protein